jgi:uncharacterized membrane protein (UPF0127 family)
VGIIAEHWIVNERVHLDVQRATGLRRVGGLIGRRLPAPGTALLIDRCGSVHGIGIRAPLDVVFCDREGIVLVVKRLSIGGLRSCRGARFVFELAAGEAARIGIAQGMRAKKSATGG